MSVVKIDPAQVTQPVAPHALGLNVNFLADHAAARERGQGYVRALVDMGVRALRYPGGEKSNEYFWSAPPWDAPSPTLSLTGPDARLVRESGLVSADGGFQVQPMDFDQFIAICRAAGAEPVVCVGLGSAYVQSNPGRLQGATRAQVIENAVEWVRYANIKRGYGVKYWEIGNESYWRGSVAPLTAEQYTRDVLELSGAMKAIDPSIRIGVNGHVNKEFISSAESESGPVWWQYLLSRAAQVIDFIVVHPYPCFEWGGYDFYTRHSPVFTEAIENALSALQDWTSPADAARIRVMATETNAFDWAATHWYQGGKTGWAWANDLGHALVLFDIIGQHLAHPRVDGVHVWNTRWFNSPSRLEDVLDEENNLLPTGQALALWGRFLHSHLLRQENGDTGPVYLAANPQTGALSVLLINKQREARNVQAQISGTAARQRARSYVYSGSGPQDTAPALLPESSWEPPITLLNLALPPVSITIIEFEDVP